MVFDGVFFTHLIMWTIGAFAILGTVLTIGAGWAMARSGYRD